MSITGHYTCKIPCVNYTANPARKHKTLFDSKVNFIEKFANNAEISLKQTMNGPETTEWKMAIIGEFNSLIKHDTWRIVNKSNGSIYC